MSRSCPACYQNNFPSSPDITINETTIEIDGAAVKFYQEAYTTASAQYNAASKTITLPHWPVNPAAVNLSLNSGWQRQAGDTLDYEVSGNIITLNFTPVADDIVYVSYMAYEAALAGAGEAVGTMHGYDGGSAPAGYVFMDGTTSLAIASYAALYAFANSNGLILSDDGTNFVLKELKSVWKNGTELVETATIIKT